MSLRHRIVGCRSHSWRQVTATRGWTSVFPAPNVTNAADGTHSHIRVHDAIFESHCNRQWQPGFRRGTNNNAAVFTELTYSVARSGPLARFARTFGKMNANIAWLLTFVTALAAASCRHGDCGPQNISPGDKFRITINSIQPGQEPCPLMPLNPGYSFVITASNVERPVGDCLTFSAVPKIPDFARGIMKSCAPGSFTLGLECEGVIADGCTTTLVMQLVKYRQWPRGPTSTAVFNSISSTATNWTEL